MAGVTNTTNDKKRGQIVPYADSRAYTDRLNALFTPQGWTREYKVETMTNITRVRKAESIVSGKVLVTCTVTVSGIGSHSGTGEEWADDENCMTSADAQAFKRHVRVSVSAVISTISLLSGSIWTEPPADETTRFVCLGASGTGAKECGLRSGTATVAPPHLPTVRTDKAKPTGATRLRLRAMATPRREAETGVPVKLMAATLMRALCARKKSWRSFVPQHPARVWACK